MDVENAAVRELATIDPHTLLDTEAARIDAFAEGLRSRDWAEPTRCDGWDRHDLLAHLAASELYNHASLDDAIAALMARAGAAGVTDLHGFNAWGVAERRDRPHSQVLQEWRDANARTREGLRARDGGDLPTLAGPYPVRRQAWHLAAELATHADDLGVPVLPAEAAARTRWRARFARFVVAEEDRGAELDHTDGATTIQVGDASAVVDDDTLVAAVSGRLDHAGSVLPASVLVGLAPRY